MTARVTTTVPETARTTPVAVAQAAIVVPGTAWVTPTVAVGMPSNSGAGEDGFG
jgi:hypothetical protein